MTKWLPGLLLTICLLVPSGCAGSSSTRRTENESLTSHRDDIDLDDLWKKGYGFNNPNAERRRQGLDSVNFDGSEDSKDSLVGKIVGGAIRGTFGLMFKAISSRFTDS